MSEALPASVSAWILGVQTGASGAQVQTLFDPDVVFEIAGRKVQGRDAVLARLSGMVEGLREAEWQVLPAHDGRTVKIRGAIPGRTIPSRGGPMSAVDMLFVLNAAGKISRVSPRPHHLEPADLQPPLGVGEVAPDFSLADVTGAFTSLRVGSAAITLVIFTCNQCPWALGWHDRLQAVIRDYGDRGMRALQVNSNDPGVSANDALEMSRRRVDNGEFSSVYLIDVGQRVARRWGARHTPEVFVLNAVGRVAYHGAPDADSQNEALSAEWVREALDALLAAREVPRAQTDPVGCTIKWTLCRCMPRIELLYWNGCMSHRAARRLLDEALAESGVGRAEVEELLIVTVEDAVREGFVGSPTIRIDGRDVFPSDDAPALTCRVYRRRDGRPSPLPDRERLLECIRSAFTSRPGRFDPASKA